MEGLRRAREPNSSAHDGVEQSTNPVADMLLPPYFVLSQKEIPRDIDGHQLR